MNVENTPIDRTRIQDAAAGNDRRDQIRLQNQRIENARNEARRAEARKAAASEGDKDGFDRTDINPERLRYLAAGDGSKSDDAKKAEGEKHGERRRVGHMRLRALFADAIAQQAKEAGDAKRDDWNRTDVNPERLRNYYNSLENGGADDSLTANVGRTGAKASSGIDHTA